MNHLSSFYSLLLSFFLVMCSSVLLAQDADTSSVLLSNEKPLIDLGESQKGGFFSKVLNTKGKKLLADIDQNNEKARALKAKTQRNKKKRKKQPKGIYEGYAIKKFFQKSGEGRKVTVLTFYYLKEFKMPSNLVDTKYFYNTEKRKIESHFRVEKENTLILHGPYEKKVNGKVVEKGYYYVGTKHGRWERYHKSGLLTYKKYFHKGFPEESEYRYYDAQKKKLKEIVPYQYGYKDGYYVALYSNGQVAKKGYFQDGERVGRWIEYYSDGGRKREIQYQKQAFSNENTAPYIRRAWDENRRQTIDNTKGAANFLTPQQIKEAEEFTGK